MFITYFEHLSKKFAARDAHFEANDQMFGMEAERDAFMLYTQIYRYMNLLRDLYKFLFIVRPADRDLVFNYLKITTYEEYEDARTGMILDDDTLIYAHRQFPDAVKGVHEIIFDIIGSPVFLVYEKISQIKPEFYFSTLGTSPELVDKINESEPYFNEIKESIDLIYKRCAAIVERHHAARLEEYDGQSDTELADELTPEFFDELDREKN